MTTENVDVITIRIHLNELKTKFDNAMREGEEFAILKKIYMDIKEMECYLQVMARESDKARGYSEYLKKHGFTKGKNPFL